MKINASTALVKSMRIYYRKIESVLFKPSFTFKNVIYCILQQIRKCSCVMNDMPLVVLPCPLPLLI